AVSVKCAFPAAAAAGRVQELPEHGGPASHHTKSQRARPGDAVRAHDGPGRTRPGAQHGPSRFRPVRAGKGATHASSVMRGTPAGADGRHTRSIVREYDGTAEQCPRLRYRTPVHITGHGPI